jgi:hypothetical protein
VPIYLGIETDLLVWGRDAVSLVDPVVVSSFRPRLVASSHLLLLDVLVSLVNIDFMGN